jgi:hypothetical protein
MRISIPCAALPAAIGSNFMLKLDERTLPSGYRLTTENPRVVRLTQGVMTKLNFGAALSRVVRVDLSARAFGTGKTAAVPGADLAQGLRRMVAKIADTPTMLRLTYREEQGGDAHLGRARLQAVERMVRKLWPGNGRYGLNIETTIVPLRQRAAGE